MCSLAFFPRILQKDARRVTPKIGKLKKINLNKTKTSKHGPPNSKEVFEKRSENVEKRFRHNDVNISKIDDKQTGENSVSLVNFLGRTKNFLLSIFKHVTSNILKSYNIPRPRNPNQFVVTIRSVSDSNILFDGRTQRFLVGYDHPYSNLHRSYCSMSSHKQAGNDVQVSHLSLIACPTNNLNHRKCPVNQENEENAEKHQKLDEMADAIQRYGYIKPVDREKILKPFELHPKIMTGIATGLNDKMTAAMINFMKETDRMRQVSTYEWQYKDSWTLAKPVEEECRKPQCLPPLGPPPILKPPPARTPPLPGCKRPKPNKPDCK